MATDSVSGFLAACFMSFHSLGGVVQAYFTYRIYVISGHWWLTAPLWVLELVDYGVHASMVVFATRSHGYMYFKMNYNGLVYAAMLLSLAVRSSAALIMGWSWLTRGSSRSALATRSCCAGISQRWIVEYLEHTES
jgi:hypothetical protein